MAGAGTRVAGAELGPPTRARYGTLGLLCALTFVLYLDRMCMGKAAPFIQRDLGRSGLQMGFVHGAFRTTHPRSPDAGLLPPPSRRYT